MTDTPDQHINAIAALGWQLATSGALDEGLSHQQYYDLAADLFQRYGLGTDYDRTYLWDALQCANFFAVAMGQRGSSLLDLSPTAAYDELRGRLWRQPTHTARTEDQLAFQQFSTPLHYAYAAFWAAGLKPGDVLVEPSAGLGGLTLFPLLLGCEVHANEPTPRRRALLERLAKFVKRFTKGTLEVLPPMDADHLHARAPHLKPDVVIMNPPFSMNGLTNLKDPMVAARHMERVLGQLKPGGRLVAIGPGGIEGKGSGMSFDAPRYKDWWKRIRERYSVRANLLISGDEYKKYGTSIQTRLIVIDKTGRTVADPLSWQNANELDMVFAFKQLPLSRGQAPAVAAPLAVKTATGSDNPYLARALANIASLQAEPVEPHLPVMQVVRDEEEEIPWETLAKQEEDAYNQEAPSATDLLVTKPEVPVVRLPDAAGDAPGEPHADLPPVLEGVREDEQPNGQINGQKSETAPPVEEPAADPQVENLPAGTPHTGEPQDTAIPGHAGMHPAGADPRHDLDKGEPPLVEAVEEESEEGVFRGYQPFLRYQHGKTHPAPLVESEAMRMVQPPVPKDIIVRLPESAVKAGRISAAQIERVAYAVFTSNQWVSDETGWKSFLIGDGTGFGKGTTLAAIAMHFRAAGFKRILWVSKSQDLISDARRDWSWVGGHAEEVFSQEGQKKEEITAEGIMFTTYTLMARRKPAEEKKTVVLNNGQELEVVSNIKRDAAGHFNEIKKKKEFKGVDRFEQVLGWRPDVILMDEAHEMGNAVAQSGTRGTKKASQKAIAAIDIMRALPRTRVIFASATAATEVHNLAYAAERMGLCGPQVPAFPDLSTFISKVSKGGMLIMELVAKDMKAMGLYQATNLSYGGTTFDLLTHALTPEQKEMYNDACAAWRLVMNEIEEAVIENGAEGNGDLNKYIKGQYYGAMQRFFNQLLTSMQTPTAILDMEQQLAAGHSIVIQLVNTNEAATERAVVAALADSESLDDLDITPRDTLMNLVRTIFPVFLYESYQDDRGNFRTRAVLDESGDNVVNPAAIARRDELLLRIGCIRVPQGALDMVIDHFGPDKVAEVTGRGARYVLTDGHRLREARSKARCNQEVVEFNEGKRRILLFSGAGNTGRSFHSDRRFGNQQRRIHYVLQAGWRADEALQGLGRTHRTNQANAPHYRLVTTELKGQKRFITSIARRIEQLGSLTKGDRKAASGGLFSAEDNLETEYATGAVWNFFYALYQNELKPLSYTQVTEQMGLNMEDDETGAISREKMPNITKFLNRLLCLECDLQDQVFDTWYEMMVGLVEEARENGTLDMGMEKLHAESITKVSEVDVHHDKTTNAVTSVVELVLKHRVRYCTWEMVNEGKYCTMSKIGYGDNAGQFIGWYRNVKSNRVFAYFKAGKTTIAKTGAVVDSIRRVHPRDYMRYNVTELTTKGDVKISAAAAEQLWRAETAKIPEFEEETVYMLTGAIMPVWDKVTRGDSRVVAATTDTGERMVGLVIEPAYLNETMRNLGAVHEGVYRTPEQLWHNVLHQGASLRLASGHTIRHSRSAGRDLVLVIGLGAGETMALVKEGLLRSEFTHGKMLAFIPYDDLDDCSRFEKILAMRPATEIIEKGVTTNLLAEPREESEKRLKEHVKVEGHFDIDNMVQLFPLATDADFAGMAPAEEKAEEAAAEPVAAEKPTVVVVETHVVRTGPTVPAALAAKPADAQARLQEMLAKAKALGKKTDRKHYEREAAGQTSLF